MEPSPSNSELPEVSKTCSDEINSYIHRLAYRRYLEGKSPEEIARWFEIHVSTVYRIIQRYSNGEKTSRCKRSFNRKNAAKIDFSRKLFHRKQTLSGSDHLYKTPIKGSNRLGRPPKIPDNSAIGMAIRYLITKYPHVYLDEIQSFLSSVFGEKFSLSSINRYLISRGFRIAVGQRIVKLSNTQDRQYFISKIPQIVKSVSQLLFVDETSHGKWTGFRRYGRSPHGTVVKMDFLPKVHPSCCLMAVMNEKGVIGYSILLETPKKASFELFISKVVLPNCNSESIVVMDNARTHDIDNLFNIFDSHNVKLLFLPAYSPDMNPIELWFQSYKQYWRRHYSDRLTRENVVACVNLINQSNDWSKTVRHVYKQTQEGVICDISP